MSDFPQSSFNEQPKREAKVDDYMKGRPMRLDTEEKLPESIADLPKASSLQRAIAWIIDMLTMIILSLIGTIPIWVSAGAQATQFLWDLGQIGIHPIENTVPADFQALNSIPGFWIGLALSILLPIAYYVIMVGRGETIGDKIAGYRIMTVQRKPPGVGRALLRYVVEAAGGIFFFFTYLWYGWDGRGQTLHDKAAGTYAISTRGKRNPNIEG